MSEELMFTCAHGDLDTFIKTARPLERFMYYRGPNLVDYILARDIRKITYKLAQKGLIYLVQQRCYIHYGYFDYYAIKASKSPIRSLVPFSDEKLREIGKVYTPIQEVRTHV